MFSDFRCSPSCPRGVVFGAEPVCPPDCFQYKGTMDVFIKVIRQVGFLLPSIFLSSFAGFEFGISILIALLTLFENLYRKDLLGCGEALMQASLWPYQL